MGRGGLGQARVAIDVCVVAKVGGRIAEVVGWAALADWVAALSSLQVVVMILMTIVNKLML